MTLNRVVLLAEKHTPAYWVEGFRAALLATGLRHTLDVRWVAGVPLADGASDRTHSQSLANALLAFDRRLRREARWSPREGTTGMVASESTAREHARPIRIAVSSSGVETVEWDRLDVSGYDLVVSMLQGTRGLQGSRVLSDACVLWAEHEGRALGASAVAFIPSLAARSFTVDVEICSSFKAGSAQLVLRSRCAMRSVSPSFNDELLAARVTDLMAVSVGAMSDRASFPRQQDPNETVRNTEPRTGRLGLGMLARVMARRVAAGATSHGDRLQWALGYRRTTAESLERSLERIPESELLIPPPGTAWADPFPVHAEGRDLVFFEQEIVCEGRGHIAVAELHPGGQFGPVQRILEGPSHLSYPCVFQSEGEWFMVPESRAAARVSLFRAVDFPFRWEWERDLVISQRLADSTVFEHDGRWWLLACRVGRGQSTYEDLVGYSAATLSGPWEQIGTLPLVSDATAGRPAGGMLTTATGLLRPAQDGSRRYGYGLALRQVTELTRSSYRESDFRRVAPNWLPELRGVHTFNRSLTLTFVDVLRRRT